MFTTNSSREDQKHMFAKNENVLSEMMVHATMLGTVDVAPKFSEAPSLDYSIGALLDIRRLPSRGGT